MFRNQYPDAPNLFSGLRRTYRPPVLAVLRRSWLTCVVGAVMVVAAVVLLTMNEGQAVRTARALEEGYSNVLSLGAPSVVFEENNGKLVLVTGELNIEDGLSDSIHGISIQAVKLKKLAQMYQWYEIEDVEELPSAVHEDDHDGHSRTTYSYSRNWFDKRLDSAAFINPMGHHNPENWPINSSIAVNQRVRIGGFILGKELKKKFINFVPFTSDERPTNVNVKMHAGLYYHANNIWDPDVGDVRVQFFYAGRHGDPVTVVGRQAGREIRPFYTESGSEELLFLRHGFQSAKDVFHGEHAQNRFRTYGFRIAGWFVAFIGLNCLGTVLDVLLDQHPYVRRVLVLGITSLPFSLSLSISLLSIGFAWLIYRPLLGSSLLALSLAPVCLAAFKIWRRKVFEIKQRL